MPRVPVWRPYADGEVRGRLEAVCCPVFVCPDVEHSLVAHGNGRVFVGGAVEILDGATWKSADCGWKGRELTVRADVPVYKTLVLRLKRKGTD